MAPPPRARALALSRSTSRLREAWLAAGLLLLAALAFATQARAQDAAADQEVVTSHGLSIFGDLKYPADFKHFDYVNPDAPKGGIYRTWSLGSYDSLTPYTEKGNSADGAWDVFDSLMTGTLDSLDNMYGLIAESVTYPQDKRWVSFKMRPEARFSDGSPLTSEDVVFSFDAMQNKGQLRYRAYFGDIEKVEALGPHEVKFTFKEGAAVRDLLPLVAGTSIFSKAYFENRDFSRSSMDPPLGSGPYQVSRADPGRTVIYTRDPDYWAKDLPVNVGRNNFDEIRIDYYADQSSAFEAFKAGEYTFRGEPNADRWLTGYDFPAKQRGDVVTDAIPARTVPYAGGLFFNLRRPAFQDPRVRQAIETMFNFEWINATLFHGVEQRAVSYWERSEMRAEGPPSAEEIAVLEPLLPELPEGLGDILKDPAAVPYASPNAGERDRARQRAAIALLTEAGYTQDGGRLVGADGKQLKLRDDVRQPRRRAVPLALRPGAEGHRHRRLAALRRQRPVARARRDLRLRRRARLRADERHPGQRAPRRLRLRLRQDRRLAQRLRRRQPGDRRADPRDRDRRDPRGPRHPRPRPRPGAPRHAHPRPLLGAAGELDRLLRLLPPPRPAAGVRRRRHRHLVGGHRPLRRAEGRGRHPLMRREASRRDRT